MNSVAEAFLSQEPLFHDVGTAKIAYRVFGEGEPLLLLHGWPLWGITFRYMLPQLAAHFKCFVIDTPGAGDTRWQQSNDFTFSGQARNFVRFVDGMGLTSFCLLAYNTGASIARQLALLTGDRVKKLVLIGTEIPGHRPPWIPLYQELVALPGAAQVFRILLQSRIPGILTVPRGDGCAPGGKIRKCRKYQQTLSRMPRALSSRPRAKLSR